MVIYTVACSEAASPVLPYDGSTPSVPDIEAAHDGQLDDLNVVDVGPQPNDANAHDLPGSCEVAAQIDEGAEAIWPERGPIAEHNRRHRYAAVRVSADSTTLSDRCDDHAAFWPVEYRWTAIGQKTQFPGRVVERFFNNGRPLDGGDRDEETTSAAFVLLSGPADVYEIWLEALVRPWPPELGGTAEEFAAGSVIDRAGPLLFEIVEIEGAAPDAGPDQDR